MAKQSFAEVVEDICRKDSRYDTEVYSFVRESLDFTIKSLKRHGQSTRGHVSGQELLSGLREFALKEYGPMSKAVLNEWGVMSCEDFGQIVFNLVNSGILGKTDADSPNDFKNGFNFDDAFVRPFKPNRDAGQPRPRARTRKTTRSSNKTGTPKGV
jgi:uncharacterized repeat protein (TIGR04138 family)